MHDRNAGADSSEVSRSPQHRIVSAEGERVAPIPIVALDFPDAATALRLVDRLPTAAFFKVGLELYTAAGPEIVRSLKDRGASVFLDLKLHDIPNTVAGAVRAAGELGVDILTVHASGGPRMLAAAVEASRAIARPPLIFAVTVLTSLLADELGLAWGKESVITREEVVRLASFAADHGAYGVVASLHEVSAIRAATRADFPVLTPGIRLAGDAAGDQSRVGTPADAAAVGATYVVLGRTVTSASDQAAAYNRAVKELSGRQAPWEPYPAP